MDLRTEDYGHHISRQFNEDLENVRSHMMKMGGLVEKQIADAVQALESGDSGLAQQVLDNEHSVNEFEVMIDNECARIMAKRQPAASDLRLVIAVTKCVNDLERVGDESAKIAKMAINLAEEGESPRGYVETRHIGNHVRKMIHDALDSFARLDVERAFEVAQEDKKVDLEYKSAARSLVTFMMEDPRSISRVLNIMWSLRALERVGDHASNIAEQVIFLVKGADVRHVPLDQIEKSVIEN